MTYSDEGKETIFKESSTMIPKDSWFQNLPHIENVRPYGLTATRAKTQLLKDYMDGTDNLSNVLSPSGETNQNGGEADGQNDKV